MSACYVVSGYFRSGTTWVANVVRRARYPKISLEPDSVVFWWAPQFVADYMSDRFFEQGFAEMLRETTKFQGYKFTRGALRWAKYLTVLESLFDVQGLYVLRHLRGVVASHIHRQYPWGFDQNEVNSNLVAMVEGGWPNDEDQPFFQRIIEGAQEVGGPYVTGVQWMAHCYEGISEAKERGHYVVSYERLCTDPGYWPAVLGFFGFEYDELRETYVKTCGSISPTGGHSGIKLSLQTQRRHGDKANGAFAFLRREAEMAGTGLPMKILDSVEEQRV